MSSLWSPAERSRFLRRRSTAAFQRAHRAECAILYRWLAHVEARTVVDVGCGDGRLFHLWTAIGSSALGVDADPAMLVRARTRAQTTATIDVVHGVVPEFQIPSADVACCIRLLGRLDEPSAHELIAQMIGAAPTTVIQAIIDEGCQATAVEAEGRLRLDDRQRLVAVIQERGGGVECARRVLPGSPSWLFLIRRRD